VRELAPEFAEKATNGKRVMIVTPADERGEFDLLSRCFFPQSGVAEDSVTGSAHCALAAYWSQQLGKEEMVGYQASERGGVVSVTVEGARVKLRGRAVTTLEGTFQA
jgi:predicted PhzF superfamily epimerase YddE/YHI9